MGDPVIDSTIQMVVSEARHTPLTEKNFDAIEDSVIYNAAWAWAYESARLAYDTAKAEFGPVEDAAR